MTPELLTKFSDYLLLAYQFSIVVPMAVVWRRGRHFGPALKLLSLYVYLSAFCSFGNNYLHPRLFATNYWFLAGFNFGKLLLFGAVYYQVLESARARRVVLGTTLVAAAVILAVFAHNTHAGITCARLAQCAVLAGFAMLYLEQTLNRPPTGRTFHDPLWLLSVGQLLYSAGTATAFSFDYFSVTVFDQNPLGFALGALGLVFNGFLTLAFLRAHHAEAEGARPPSALATQLAPR